MPSAMTDQPSQAVWTEAEWETFFWSLVRDDLPGAYWLAHSWEAREQTTPVPSWLLAAVQGARWLNDSEDTITRDLAEIVQQHGLQPNTVHQLLAIAAALVPSIVAPATGLTLWLQECPLHELSGLVQAVRTYANLGHALRQKDLTRADSQAELSAAIEEVVNQAKRWAREGLARRTRFKRSNDIWRFLISPDAEFGWILDGVAANDQTRGDEIRARVREWQSYPLEDRIHDVDADLHGRQLKPIVGVELRKLVNDINRGLELAEKWGKLLKRQEEIETQDDWFGEQRLRLVNSVTAALPTAMTALQSLQTSQADNALLAVSCAVRQSLEELCVLVHIQDIGSDPFTMWYCQRTDPRDGLWRAMAHRLLALPELALDDEKRPSQSGYLILPDLLRTSHHEERSLRQAFYGWVMRQDYRFLPQILTLLHDEPDVADLTSYWLEAQSKSQSALAEAIHRTTQTIEQALIDGVITEESHVLYNREIEALANGKYGCHFIPCFDVLEAITSEVRQLRADRLQQQRLRWERIRGQLENGVITDVALRARLASFAQEALERKDTLVLDEWLASLETSLGQGMQLDLGALSPIGLERDVYQEFLECFPELVDRLHSSRWSTILGTIKSNRWSTKGKVRQLSRPRLQAALRGLRHWQELRSTTGQDASASQRVVGVLQYLGFSFPTDRPSAIQELQCGQDWQHLTVNMSASDLSPVPQFGSEQEGHFHVLCLWERPGSDTIGARLHDLHLRHSTVIILYLGRLMERHRLDILNFARSNHLAIVILDEVLLLFLIAYWSRLTAFFRCALPLAHVNPYVATGVVAPEMFFGRTDLVSALESPGGPAIVYGGRQLGKSALLRRIVFDFHRPEREQYVIYEDVKLLGDPASGQHPETIWRRLRDDLQRLGLLNTKAGTPERILREIREVLVSSPQRRVLVLLDEADRFLKFDAEHGFVTVSELKRLRDDCNGRFKVVYAGLHNVQRFQSIPNQPLAHLSSVLVGPLEPEAARALIRRPMEALGFRFADERTVLRILALTNYHPGLIQLFCRELLERLQGRKVTDLDTYMVQQADVEEVYRSQDVRDEIRKRFDWTLALDPGYQAIAWTIVIDQVTEGNSYRKTYRPADMRKLWKDLWPQGYESMTMDELHGLMLEMCGLGVLVRITEGYRLRSPNLVQLMGSGENIKLSLYELANRQPDSDAIVPHSYRAPLDSEARLYSPFTYVQTSILSASRSGVVLVFGSNALGLAHSAEALHHIAPFDHTDLGAEDQIGIQSSDISSHTIQTWLRESAELGEENRPLVVHKNVQGKAEQLADLVETALAACQRQEREHRRSVRFFLAFDPEATWQWMLLDADRRHGLEEHVYAAIWLQRWDFLGVRQQLDQHGKMSSPEDCRNLLAQTGGWPWLLDCLRQHWNDDNNDPAEGMSLLWRQLDTDEELLRTRFITSLGVLEESSVDRVLSFVIEQGPVPSELLTADLIGQDLDSFECRAARDYLHGLGLLEMQNDEFEVEAIVKRLLSNQP